MIDRSLIQLLVAVSILLSVASSHASQPTAEQLAQRIDQTVAEVMATYAVPGVAIAIVEGEQVIFANTYGVQEFGQATPITSDSLFKIASVSKNFTTAALAVLIDEGKLSWDDRVIDHLPEFRTSDPWITAEFRVRDLLIHSSGLNLGAGDLMFWPTPNDFTREDILKGLK
jgi:CubicO group peptidase (beta-lactamase class C family)